MKHALPPLILSALVVCSAAVVLGLGGCGKAADKAVEKAVEKALEADVARQGGQAQVSLGEGQTRSATTVTEADLGVPLYPGSRIDPALASRMVSPEGSMVIVMLDSADPPEKVAAFYRSHLSGRSAGAHYMESRGADGGAVLILGDDSGRNAVNIAVAKGDKGTQVQIQNIKGKP